MQGVDEETDKLHRKGNMEAVFGDKAFKQWGDEALLPELAAEGKVVQSDLTMLQVTDGVAVYYKTSADDMRKISRGPQQKNEARKAEMYLCQELSAAKLREIADYFNLNHAGSGCFITHQIRQKKSKDKGFKRKLEHLNKKFLNQVT